jgi:hypothetical protein
MFEHYVFLVFIGLFPSFRKGLLSVMPGGLQEVAADCSAISLSGCLAD